jgi:CRT10
LIVGELGSEEILFLSTDSGNVAAYYTASIQEGIEKGPYKFSEQGSSDLVGIRPFFTHWVYESAWGLSIHKHARMLAVSSNKPHYQPTIGVDAAVTVFAFALTNGDEPSVRQGNDKTGSSKEDDSEWRLWLPDAANPTRLPDRSLNWRTRLEAHTCNIPSISFINSDDDRKGNYLLSTDIQGITKCWHIWQRNIISTWNFCGVGTSSNPYLNSQETL